MLEKTLMFKCSLLIIRMEENGISNVYIDKLMEKISRSFRGTFSIDNIPVFEDDVFSVIINLSKQNEIGTHFIAVYVLENKIIYFDSFGNQLNNSSLKRYLKKYKKPIILSKIQIQNLLSSHCGFFCIAFILCIENGITLDDFLKKFYRKKLHLNDYICVKIIKIFINHMYLRN